ncbi:MAG: AAA family ATPase, partial [Candidatus Aenigmatarchaeota archaeon]
HKVLERCKVAAEPAIPYLPQGREVESLEVYRKVSKSVLLVGPTGVGKSMLVRRMAQVWGLPFLYATCDPDKTEGKMMGRPDMVFGTVEVNGETKMVHFQQFRPSAISVAGMSGEPVVLFIDELHKLRRDMDVLFHPLVNEREVNLSDHLGPGEVYKLHPETVIIFALNPYYQDGGIEKVGPAMRQRLATIDFEMVTNADRLLEIVKANLGDLGGREDIAKRICEMSASLCRVYLEHHKRTVVAATDSASMEVKNRLRAVLMSINEAPSPRLLVDSIRAMKGGLDPATAVLQGIFNAITNDFGATARALQTIAQDVYNIK